MRLKFWFWSAGVFGLFVISLPVSGQSLQSVSLAWEASPLTNAVAYSVYEGPASGGYTNKVAVGNVTTVTLAGLVPGATYFFTVTAIDGSGLESVPSNEVSYQVPSTVASNPSPGSTLTFQADSGVITAPFAAANGTISQDVLTGVTDGGRAVYSFSLANAGDYVVSATVSAPSLANNSFYVNLDAEPTDPLMIWDIPVTAGFASQTVTWRGNGNGDPAASQYIPKIFTLAAGAHQLIVRGREQYTALGTITISAYGTNVPPAIALTSPLPGFAGTAPAAINCVAAVTANGHTITKVQFYNGSTLLGETASAPYTFAWNNVGPGNYSLAARAVYDAGSTIDSSPATVLVTNPPPDIVMTSPVAGTPYVAPAAIGCAATVTANGHAIRQVQFYSGATLLGTAATTPYSLTWSNVGPGNYTLTAQAIYDVANTVVASPVGVTVTGLPAPWQTADIGSLGAPGSATESNGVYMISGAGVLSGTADGFCFVYQSLSANGEIRAQLRSVGTGAANGCVGLMIRESLTPGSKYAFVGVTPTLAYRWQRRASTSGSTASSSSGTAAPPNAWIRLLRSNSTLYGYLSTDGLNWTKVGSARISMAVNVYFGLVVASGDTNVLNTSAFANVTLMP